MSKQLTTELRKASPTPPIPHPSDAPTLCVLPRHRTEVGELLGVAVVSAQGRPATNELRRIPLPRTTVNNAASFAKSEGSR